MIPCAHPLPLPTRTNTLQTTVPDFLDAYLPGSVTDVEQLLPVQPGGQTQAQVLS